MDKSELQKIFTPEQYQVELFHQKDFKRKKCSKCDHMFWTVDPDRTTCGDTTCEGGYTFIGRKGPNWDFHETISQLTKFFSKHGHTPIDPYPVVARWREDLEFTIASIADFQPWVTSGTLPPPANPLTVPQPCIRFGGEFSDTDNVGRTGRHLTSFVMFGQHAFNSETLTDGYWMNRCIDLNFKFLTENLKLAPEEITYIEGIWKGGGNFGPNLESFAFGSEIVNSVFMQYQETPNGYREMDLRVIDVGWGLERTAWFSQGTPTIYEATFNPILEYMKKETGVQVDRDLLENYSKLAGLIDINEVKDVKSTRIGIADKLGFTLEELNQELAEIEALYAIGDHSRTICWTLSDGAIPSNVGGGYNLRSLIRRLFTMQDLLELNLDFVEVMDRSILYLADSYPRVKEARDIVPTILDIESTRYRKTIDSGKKFVNQIIKSKKTFNDQLLVDLYTSRGIPPETVKSIASNYGKSIEIPMDFYQQVDSAIPTSELKQLTQEDLDLSLLSNLHTEKLYYDDNWKDTCEAKVVLVLNSGHLVVDQTVFYPLGGGQAEDLGWIQYGKKKYKVTDVKKYNDAIVHRVENLPSRLKVGSKVKLIVDWERRMALTRHHTAVHLVGGAAREILGKHVWQAGADKNPERARLDITHWEGIPRETLDEIEMLANSIVMDNRSVKKQVMERSEAEERFGFTIYQGGVVPGRELRIIEIPGIDTEACGGTHADKTGDIGYIRILGAERIQDGIVRITLTAGKRAVLQSQADYQLLKESADTFAVNPEDMPRTANRFFNEWKSQRKSIENLSKELASARIPLLLDQAEEITTQSGKKINLIITEYNAPQSELLTLGEKISNMTTGKDVLFFGFGKYQGKAMIVSARSAGSKIDHNKVLRPLCRIVGGGGGGKKDVIAGGGTKVEKLLDARRNVKSIVKENL